MKLSLPASALDPTSYPAWRDHLMAAEEAAHPDPPRRYPGYPCWPLPVPRVRLWPSLDRALTRRRRQALGGAFPSRRRLARLLRFAHGITGPDGRGPTPSAGGLQALELYLAPLDPSGGWLPAGAYHYDRAGHHLAQVAADVSRERLAPVIPSLAHVPAAPLVWLIVGDGARAGRKYGDRAARFLLLEAGHLMQNLCLLSATLGLGTVPLGGFFEEELRSFLGLPSSDEVLYVGACGESVEG